MGSQGEVLQPITLDEEFSKNPELRKDDLELLREWAQKQPHLPQVLDTELVLFLHSCNYSVESAKSALDTYFTTRSHLPEFFANRDASLPEVQNACAATGFVTLPKATPEGYKVIFFRPVDQDLSKFVHADVKKVFLMVIDLWLRSEGTAPGHVIVFDMNGVSFSHFTRLSLITFKKFFFYLQDALPFRLKGLHFVNVVPFMDKMMAMMKPFMKKEISSVIHIHTEGLESLFKHVSQDIFPEDYGGTAPPFMELYERVLPRLLANREYFEAEEQRVVDETKRQGRSRTADELFGVEGTFKKLEID